MTFTERLSKIGKFVADTAYVGTIESRVVIAENVEKLADAIQPTPEQIAKSAKIQLIREREAEIAKRAKPVDAKFQTVKA